MSATICSHTWMKWWIAITVQCSNRSSACNYREVHTEKQHLNLRRTQLCWNPSWDKDKNRADFITMQVQRLEDRTETDGQYKDSKRDRDRQTDRQTEITVSSLYNKTNSPLPPWVERMCLRWRFGAFFFAEKKAKTKCCLLFSVRITSVKISNLNHFQSKEFPFASQTLQLQELYRWFSVDYRPHSPKINRKSSH